LGFFVSDAQCFSFSDPCTGLLNYGFWFGLVAGLGVVEMGLENVAGFWMRDLLEFSCCGGVEVE
jgi:hypothetical protein